ncbi:MAG TPA: GAF domain-containing sensor histidine kinase [Steroidobacteraceae bacterium]|nr:GAF domain-containing sensor histidine kinase [Steroidobacteraceae bacterium]
MSTHPMALQELDRPAALRAAELAAVNASLQRRESLLAASATASRLLLEAPDAMKVMPEALRLLGEAAEVDRTALALAEVGPNGERWLVIKSEWVAQGVSGHGCDARMGWDERKSDCYCSELKSGRSVFVRPAEAADFKDFSITGERAKSSVIVPIIVDGEYAGAIGFDDCHRPREFDSALVSALEIAAGLIGAALHRERLMETMRREREQAAEARVAELANANAAIRANLEQLASEPDLCSFMEHMLFEATRQLEAASGSVVVLDETATSWHVIAHVNDGRVVEPSFAATVRTEETTVGHLLDKREPQYFELEKFTDIGWPGTLEFHRGAGHQSFYAMPLVFGDRTIGFIGLAFRHRDQLKSDRVELLVALAQQATLCIGMKRLAVSAKNAAVLAERNRIGQEIHDGLAQGFTGILMQLGAAEEHMGCAKHSPLPEILGRIRDLAREGLSEARRSVLALKPDQARAGGLEVALRQLAQRSTIAGRVNCVFAGGISSGGPAPEHQHELLRIAQEAVINAARHAHPKTITITLIEEQAHWSLTVIDDGQGMEELPELYAQQGFGLANMRERARAIGGVCEIHSKPGRGTQVIVRLPRAKSR